MKMGLKRLFKVDDRADFEVVAIPESGVLGRGRDTVMPIPHGSCSRNQATYAIEGDALVLTHLTTATNPTFVNGTVITTGRAVVGDKVSFANADYEVVKIED